MAFTDKKIPLGIRLLAWATAIRWLGWGLVEVFIPVFLALLSTNHTTTGLLASTYTFVFLLSLPFIGYFTDRKSAKKVIIFGLVLYPFVGLSYLLAGITGMVLFIFLARALNGVAYASDSIGRSAFIMKHAPKNRESYAFGYVDVIINSLWIVGTIIGLYLILSIPLHWLFIGIIPTSVIALVIVLKIKEKRTFSRKFRLPVKSIINEFFSEIKKYSKGLRTIVTVNFYLGFVDTAIFFFIPIVAFMQGASILQSGFIGLVYAIPSLFGRPLGKIADKKRETCLIFGSVSLALLFVVFGFLTNYYWQLAIAFAAGIALELISLTNNGIIARLARPLHFGRINSSMQFSYRIGSLIGPVLTGILLDTYTLQRTFSLLGVLSLVMTAFLISRKDSIKTT